ncbi:hypothetical protein KQI86_01555 [Clostridium sp. MSJ-11]|uniref:Uncharacterized protein n=1 Tax=Clostridium mobile TaxID=2841512 RepID=A0ABS6EDX9_9CLOT|nr:hypothetical protein [Clostridium mobile]MBU5482992.1 hypothetical protein [Clostridium mobile]
MALKDINDRKNFINKLEKKFDGIDKESEISILQNVQELGNSLSFNNMITPRPFPFEKNQDNSY